MIRWSGSNLRTILWSFAMALAVWVAAVSVADPNEVRAYLEPIPVEIIGQDPGLVISSEIPDHVQISLRAPRSIWDRLITEEYNIQAILDLSGLSEGQHTLDLQIHIPIRPVRIVSATPGTATIILEPLATQSFPIMLDLSGDPALGYQAGDPSLDPEEIIISGPRSQVERVEILVVRIDLDDARSTIEKSIVLEAIDENNQIIPGLGLNPSEVLFSLPISQQGGFRDLAVKVDTKGQVASGYWLANISVFPPVITVFSGDPALVNSMPGVLDTQPLYLDNADDVLSTRLGLILPEGVSLVGEQTVLVQVDISPIQSSLTLESKTIDIRGLPDGWSVEIAPENVDVILSGPLPLLETLSSQQVLVVLDLTELEEGTHQLTPDIEILVSDITVESILPGTVEVIISNNGLITPTP